MAVKCVLPSRVLQEEATTTASWVRAAAVERIPDKMPVLLMIVFPLSSFGGSLISVLHMECY